MYLNVSQNVSSGVYSGLLNKSNAYLCTWAWLRCAHPICKHYDVFKECEQNKG